MLCDLFSQGREDQFFFELPPEKAIGQRLEKVAIFKSTGVLPDDWHLKNFTLSDITNNKIYDFECNVGAYTPPTETPMSFRPCTPSPCPLSPVWHTTQPCILHICRLGSTRRRA